MKKAKRKGRPTAVASAAREMTKARVKTQSPERRREIASLAARKRWDKEKGK